MNDAFQTLNGKSEGLYKEKGSKFCAYAYPVNEENQIKKILEELKSVHPASRHICYAYILGIDQENYRANDDGEPSGTAGLPILGQIKSKGMTNILVAVVRYFGGTKLGASGLKNAYKISAREALDNGKSIEKVLQSSFEVKFEYEATGMVMSALNELNATIKSQDFKQSCLINFTVRQKDTGKVNAIFAKMGNLELRLINA